MRGFRALEFRDDELERFVPRDALEAPFAFATFAYGRMEDAIRAVDALIELPHLCANVAVGDRVLVRAVDPDHSSVLNGDGEAAGVGTVEGARGLDD